MRGLMHIAAGVAALALSLPALSQAPIAYPAKGQSPQQQSRDDGECYGWAKQKTGIDPMAPAQPSQPGGERIRGAARGAVGGAAIGAIAGDTGKGAGVGAVVGTMAGGHRARSREASEKQQTADTFNRAYRACMQGRGYSVN